MPIIKTAVERCCHKTVYKMYTKIECNHKNHISRVKCKGKIVSVITMFDADIYFLYVYSVFKHKYET